MTTEETEITFIRCPSCRSLVPSVATRCRMCGHQFQKTEASAPQGGEEKRSRIRQRTISVTRGEGEQLNISPAVSAEAESPAEPAIPFRDHFGSAPEGEEFAPKAESPEADESRDLRISEEPTPDQAEQLRSVRPLTGGGPLTFRSERTEVKQEKQPLHSIEPHEEEEGDFDEDLDDEAGADSEEHDEGDEHHAEVHPAAAGEPRRKRRRRRRRKKKGPGAILGSELSSAETDRPGRPAEDRGMAQPVERVIPGFRAAESRQIETRPVQHEPSAPFAPPNKPAVEKTAAVREDLFGAANGRRGEIDRPKPPISPFEPEPVSFSAANQLSRDEQPAEPIIEGELSVAEPVTLLPEAEPISFSPASPIVDEPESALQPEVPEKSQLDSAVVSSAVDSFDKGLAHTVIGATMESTHTQGQSGAPHATAGIQQTAAAGDGTLVGWLVSYGTDRRGTAIELRGGRFFVGRQRLRASDLVLADDSVSTPHCLLNAAPGDGLMVQDLMSERGTAIRKAGSQNFVNCADPVKLQHGDWLRFGNFEVMVCLIPGQGRNGQ